VKSERKLHRDSKFSFACKACGLCCHDKKIQLNPYEIVRLADHLSIGTAEFLARYLTPGEPFLLFLENSACVFLTDEGCSVHPDRPLVCRLYPLGHHLSGEGVEHFRCTEPQSGCSGELGNNGTVTTFLDSQEAGPYMEAAEKYLELFYRLYDTMYQQLDVQDINDLQHTSVENSLLLKEWFDVDGTIDFYCAEKQLPVPTDHAGRTNVHINALEDKFGS
jgi:uncharacterized protein